MNIVVTAMIVIAALFVRVVLAAAATARSSDGCSHGGVSAQRDIGVAKLDGFGNWRYEGLPAVTDI